MQLYILNKDYYEQIAVIEEAESKLWNKKYNDVGYCEIYMPCNNEMLFILQKGNYIYRYDDDMFCKIETVEIKTDVENGDYIIATAEDICNILAGRIIRFPVAYSGTVAGFVEKILNDNVINPAQTFRKIENFEIDTSNFTELNETLNISTANQDLLELIKATCKAYNYGFRVSYNINTHKLVFRLYKGKNKATADGEEYIEFSPTYANIISSTYKDDSSNYKNIAYIGYKTETEETVLELVYLGDREPRNEERREIYVDGTNISREIKLEELEQLFPTAQEDLTAKNYYIMNGAEKIIVATYELDGNNVKKITVTDYTYMLLIRAIGVNALVNHANKQEFGGEVDTIDTYSYKVDYNLGDTVKVINDYGIEAEAQITEILESEDTENGYLMTPQFEFRN